MKKVSSNIKPHTIHDIRTLSTVSSSGFFDDSFWTVSYPSQQTLSLTRSSLSQQKTAQNAKFTTSRLLLDSWLWFINLEHMSKLRFPWVVCQTSRIWRCWQTVGQPSELNDFEWRLVSYAGWIPWFVFCIFYPFRWFISFKVIISIMSNLTLSHCQGLRRTGQEATRQRPL